MGAIASLSALTSLATGGDSGAPEDIPFHKDYRVAGVAPANPTNGRIVSFWLFDGSPGPGAAPGGTVRIPTRATNGALGQTNPAGGKQRWATLFALSTGGGTYFLYDRLLDISGFSGTNTSAQSVGGSITRYTSGIGADGIGNEIWVEIYSQIGATGTTITANYTNQAGASKTTPAVVIGGTGFREANRIIRLPMAVGDIGVQAVASVTLAGTTGTVGDFGVTVAHPLCTVSAMRAATGGIRTILEYGIEVLTDACLAVAGCVGTSDITPPHLQGHIFMVDA